ncbi:MAG: DUF3114 domain-containing protein [Streptococcus sp.]
MMLSEGCCLLVGWLFLRTAYLKFSIERQIHQLHYLISNQQAQYVRFVINR